MTSRPLLLLLTTACAAGSASLREPHLAPLPIPTQADEFRRDRGSAISEEALRALLDAPPSFDPDSRVGVLPVTDRYNPDRALPLPSVPAELTRALESVCESATEMSADWPADSDVPGLRELAARYRSGYLVLYRQRFADDSHENAWALLYVTIIGGFLAPSRTVETAGVLEATLFDVRTGTLLFTVYERVRGREDVTPPDTDRKLNALKTRLLEQAGPRLAEQVTSKLRRLTETKRAPAAGAPSS